MTSAPALGGVDLVRLLADRERSKTAGESKARPPDPWEQSLATALADIRTALGKSTTVARKPMFQPAAELFDRVFPPTSWQVTGVIAKLGTAVIASEPKSIKTWMVIEFAMAIATGTKAFGEFATGAPGHVAMFCAEEGAQSLRNRLRAVAEGRGMNPREAVAHIHICPRGESVDVLEDLDLAWILASCRALGVKLEFIVLDPLRDVHSGEEDKSDSMTQVMKRIRLLGILLGCTVCLVHHTAKASVDSAKRRPGQRMRGSGAIHGSIDSGIYLSDLKGDGMTTFSNTVDIETKGAKSAGRLTVKLVLEDNAEGEAIKADWSVSREPSKAAVKTSQADADDAAVFAFVRDLAMRGEHHSRRALRDHDELPIAEKRGVAALQRLIDAGQLVLVGPEVRLPEGNQGDRS